MEGSCEIRGNAGYCLCELEVFSSFLKDDVEVWLGEFKVVLLMSD